MQGVSDINCFDGWLKDRGISSQEQTRWLSWNVDGGVRGFDLARNPGLSNNMDYGAGEFQLPTRPLARSAGQSTSKPPSMIVVDVGAEVGGGVHGGPHVIRYVIDFRSAMLCIKIGYRVYNVLR